ncbi:MAG: 3'-5' exonuclease [Oscillospiraceae bacterium]|nr:3'-5' exonuclease [Oscillospiraceae bacterium]
MSRYIAFDVETPNRYNNRMSAIGISVIEDGVLAGDFYSLVDPEQPFDWFNSQLTGIDAEAVSGAPVFPELWERIEPLMSSGILVAHNASFDTGVLRKCLIHYEIDWLPRVQGICTVLMGRALLPGIGHRLNELCAYYGIALDHHHAGSDSRACAEILLRYIEGGADPVKFIRTYQMR